MEAASQAAALHKRQHNVAVLPAAASEQLFGLAFLPTGSRFVYFHDTTSAAHRSKLAVPHRFTDAMAEEPRGLVRDLQCAVHLMRRNALLARTHEVDGLEHLRERNMSALENGADRHAMLATAVLALVEAGASCLALELGGSADHAAMGADRAVRPKHRL